MNIGFWAKCLFAAMLCMHVVAYAQPRAQISGSVVDATGQPLVGATIALRGPADISTQTSAEGRFDFLELRPGEYQLTASFRGFATTRRTARLGPAEKLDITLTLTPLFVEHTVVTASRTGETDLQATPMAVAVLNGRDLSRTQDHTIEDVVGRAPGVSLSQNTGLAQLTIRGIGTNAVFAGSDPSSAVYLDGVYLARPGMVLADFLDLERIEVLRGPQGTLYGRNSLGGAINLISQPPTDHLEASVHVAAGNQGTLRTDARVSGPMLAGRVRGSAAFLRGIRTGQVNDLEHPEHPLNGDDVTAARGQVHVSVNARTDLHVSADVTHSDPAPSYYSKILAVKPGFAIDNPPGFYDVRASFPAEGRTFQSGVSARLTLALTPSLTLTSLSAYRNLDFDVVVDGDASELDLDISRVHDIQHQLSEELTLGARNARVTWLAGLYMFTERDREPSSTVLPGPRLEFRLEPDVGADANAAFGQATVTLTRGLSATVGLRYTHESKTIENGGGLYTADSPTTLLSDSYSYADAISQDAWTPKFGAELRVRENVLAYTSATRGFKSGGFNATSTAPGRGYGPEWAWSYEGGLKAVVLGRTRLNAAGFYTNYTDLQVQTPISTTLLDVSNAASATIRGVELETTARVGRLVQAGGHVAWLDATYDRYLAVGPAGGTVDVAGRRLNNAPEWSGRLWLEWTPAIGPARVLSLRADSTWKSTVFYTPFNDSIQRQQPLGLLDLSAEFGPTHRRWLVTAFARNLTNEQYITGSNNAFVTATGGRLGDRRQFGAELLIGR